MGLSSASIASSFGYCSMNLVGRRVDLVVCIDAGCQVHQGSAYSGFCFCIFRADQVTLIQLHFHELENIRLCNVCI